MEPKSLESHPRSKGRRKDEEGEKTIQAAGLLTVEQKAKKEEEKEKERRVEGKREVMQFSLEEEKEADLAAECAISRAFSRRK